MFKINQNQNVRDISDRYIPRRIGVNLELSNYNLKIVNDKKDIPNTKHITIRRNQEALKTYYSLLLKANRITEPFDAILHFSPLHSYTCAGAATKNNFEKLNDWPIRKRKEPICKEPLVLLDMPGVECHPCQNKLDWSSSDFLTAIYEEELHFYNTNDPQQFTTFKTCTHGRIQDCLSWNKDGTLLAIALKYKTIGLWSLKDEKQTHENYCLCLGLCKITAIAWSADETIVTGCNLGRITVWSNTLYRCASFADLTESDCIVALNFSAYENYICVNNKEGILRVFKWPQLQLQLEIHYNFIIKRGVAWHPWRESLLCVGGYPYGTIQIWNVALRKVIAYKESQSPTLYVSCLTWNPITAELVVAYFDPMTNTQSIVFLSSLDGSVDDFIDLHEGVIVHLLWNHDGTQLVTCGDDEKIYIWQYIKSANNKSKKRKRKSKMEDLSLPCTKKVLNTYCIR